MRSIALATLIHSRWVRRTERECACVHAGWEGSFALAVAEFFELVCMLICG